MKQLSITNVVQSIDPIRDIEDIEELMVSIQSQGLIVPIIVREYDGKYQVVAGNRRLEAHKRLHLPSIDAIIIDADNDEAKTKALVENVVRVNMSAIDIARTLKAIKDAKGWTNEKLGEQFGWSESTVRRYLEMLDYEIAVDSDLTSMHVIEAKAGVNYNLDLFNVPDDKKKMVIESVLQYADDWGLSTRDTRTIASALSKDYLARGEKALEILTRTEPENIIAYEYEDTHIQPKPKGTTTTTQPRVDEEFTSWLSDIDFVNLDVSMRKLSQNIQKMGDKIGTSKRKDPETAYKLLEILSDHLYALSITTKQMLSDQKEVDEMYVQAEEYKDDKDAWWDFLRNYIDKKGWTR